MRICAITHHQLVNNPRLTREADALARAGHDVRIVSVKQTPEQSALDARLAAGRAWRWQPLDIERTASGTPLWFMTGVRKKTARRLWKLFKKGDRLAGHAYTRTFSETVRKICAEPTELIIAHTQPMLAPAFFAAKKMKCRWNFDFEDLLSEEYGEGIQDPDHQSLVRYVEKSFIPRAFQVTVASACYAEWLKENLGRADALLVRNVPSLAGAPEKLSPGYPAGRGHLSLYWFSQSIGPLRGIEDALEALALLEIPAQLHLRGELLPEFKPVLERHIERLGLQERVFIHPRIEPERLPEEAARHDIGLGLMQPCCLNHELAVPNKLYAYMMAGLAVIATDTRGHRSVFSEAPGIGALYTPGNGKMLAEKIMELVSDPRKLAACRVQALTLASESFNWENEQRTLVERIARCA